MSLYAPSRWQKYTIIQPLTFTQKTKKSLFESHFLDLWVTYAHRLQLVGKPVVDFIVVVRLRRYEWKSVEVSVFRRGWVTLSAYFREKGASPTNHCWCQKIRDCRFVRYQNIRSPSFSYVTIHASDRRTDRQTGIISTAIPCVALHAVAG